MTSSFKHTGMHGPLPDCHGEHHHPSFAHSTVTASQALPSTQTACLLGRLRQFYTPPSTCFIILFVWSIALHCRALSQCLGSNGICQVAGEMAGIDRELDHCRVVIILSKASRGDRVVGLFLDKSTAVLQVGGGIPCQGGVLVCRGMLLHVHQAV